MGITTSSEPSRRSRRNAGRRLGGPVGCRGSGTARGRSGIDPAADELLLRPGKRLCPRAASADPRRHRPAGAPARSRPTRPGTTTLRRFVPARTASNVSSARPPEISRCPLGPGTMADGAALGEDRLDVALVGRRRRIGRPDGAPCAAPPGTASEQRESLRDRVSGPAIRECESPLEGRQRLARSWWPRSMVEQELLGIEQGPEQVLGPAAGRGLGEDRLGRGRLDRRWRAG